MLSRYLLLPVFTSATPLTSIWKRQNISSLSPPGGSCTNVTDCVYNYGCTNSLCNLIPTGDSCGAGAGPLNAISLCASGLCEITCQSSGLPCSLGNCIQNGNGVVGSGTLCLQNSECQGGLFCEQYRDRSYGSCQAAGSVGKRCANSLTSQGSALSPNPSCTSGRCDWNSQTESGTFICLPSVGSVRVGGNCTTDSDCSTDICTLGVCRLPTANSNSSSTTSTTISPSSTTASTSSSGSLSRSASSLTPASPTSSTSHASSSSISRSSSHSNPTAQSSPRPGQNPTIGNPGNNSTGATPVVTVGTTQTCDVEHVCWSGRCVNGHCAPLNPPAGINGACSNNVDCSGYSITAGASTANCTDLTSAVGSGICGIVGSSTIPHNTSVPTGDSCTAPGSLCFSGNCTSGLCQPGATKGNLHSSCSANADCAGFSIDNSSSKANCTGIGRAVGSGICTPINIVKPPKSGLSTGAKAGIGAAGGLVAACLLAFCVWLMKFLARSKEKEKENPNQEEDNEAQEKHKKPKVKMQEFSIALIGLDGHGKTSFLCRARQIFNTVSFDSVSVVPTRKTEMTRVGVGSSIIEFYDFPGRRDLRPQWKKKLSSYHGICYVVDCTDVARSREALMHLQTILSNSKVTGTPVLVLLNKIDSPYSAPYNDIQHRLENILRFRPVGSDWAILPISAARGDGVEAAVTWLFAHAQTSRKALKKSATGFVTHNISGVVGS